MSKIKELRDTIQALNKELQIEIRKEQGIITIENFVTTHFIEDSHGFELNDDIYEKYESWCAQRGVKKQYLKRRFIEVLCHQLFDMGMKKVFKSKRKRKGIYSNVLQGISLKGKT